jgi:hypothetical protein
VPGYAQISLRDAAVEMPCPNCFHLRRTVPVNGYMLLDGLPKDVDLPFPPRSQSAYRIQTQERQQEPAAEPCP